MLQAMVGLFLMLMSSAMVDANGEGLLVNTHTCSQCGYVYDKDAHGDGQAFEDLPDDWVCPICGAPKSAFDDTLQSSLSTEPAAPFPLSSEADTHTCSRCGYVYDKDAHGDGQAFEDLPDDWVCPICGAPKSAFVDALQSSHATEAAPALPLSSEADTHTCSRCGYVYDKDADGRAFEDLPDDWVCPICGAPKSAFVEALQSSLATEAAPALPLSSEADTHTCSQCGYVYDKDADGDGQAFEDLPDDWVCPRCGAPKSAFVEALQSSHVTEAAPALPLSSEADTHTCATCGYVYDNADGDGRAFEDLPDDWVCPICGAPKYEFVDALRSSPIAV